MLADSRGSPELDKLRSEFRRAADELERLQELKADYVSAIAKFESGGDDLAGRPGCLGMLLGAGDKRDTGRAEAAASAGGEAPGASPARAAADAERQLVREIRAGLAELEQRDGVGADELREAYAEAVAALAAEKERLIR